MNFNSHTDAVVSVAVALVKEEGLDEFLEKVKRGYWQKVGGKMRSWVMDVVSPASELEE